MSRTLETRAVEQLAAVYWCDRCGAEIPPCETIGIDRPGAGAGLSLSAHPADGKQDWRPLLDVPSGLAEYEAKRFVYEAATPDLCESCTVSLIEWFAEGAA